MAEVGGRRRHAASDLSPRLSYKGCSWHNVPQRWLASYSMVPWHTKCGGTPRSSMSPPTLDVHTNHVL